jgi:hypothetical protein
MTSMTRVRGGRHPVYRCDGTPTDCVRAGHVTVTPLSSAVELGDLSPGLRHFITRQTEAFPLAT